MASSHPRSPGAALLREQAERARLVRVENEEARQKKSEEALRQLQARWSQADKAVEVRRDQLYAVAKEKISNWQVKKAAAKERNTASDVAKDKRMQEAWVTKQLRFAEWRKEKEAENQRKAEELAATLHAASGRLEQELLDRNTRLEEAQERAAERRAAMEAEKQRQLQEKAELAEQREAEAWASRVRVETANRARIEHLDANCRRKAKQAEECLKKRYDRIGAVRVKNVVWRVPGSRDNL